MSSPWLNRWLPWSTMMSLRSGQFKCNQTRQEPWRGREIRTGPTLPLWSLRLGKVSIEGWPTINALPKTNDQSCKMQRISQMYLFKTNIFVAYGPMAIWPKMAMANFKKVFFWNTLLWTQILIKLWPKYGPIPAIYEIWCVGSSENRKLTKGENQLR